MLVSGHRLYNTIMLHYLGRGSKACYGDSGDDEGGLPGRWDLTLNID